MSSSSVPGYWLNETSGVLQPVVMRYLEGAELDAAEVRVMRAYLRQWISGAFVGPGVAELRRTVELIETVRDLHSWLDYASDCGIDPL